MLAKCAYKIVPVKDSELYSIKNEEANSFSSNYTLDEAIDRIENYREIEFKILCYKVLYERRKKRVENL